MTIANLFALHANATRSWLRLKCLCAEHAPISWHPARFTSHMYCDSGNINFSKCHVTLRWSRDQRVKWLERWETLTVSQQLS